MLLNLGLPLAFVSFSVLGKNGVKTLRPMTQVFTKGIWTMTYTSSLPHTSTVRNTHTYSTRPLYNFWIDACSLWHSALLRQLLIYSKCAPTDLLPRSSKFILLGDYHSMRLPHIHACVVCRTNTHTVEKHPCAKTQPQGNAWSLCLWEVLPFKLMVKAD